MSRTRQERQGQRRGGACTAWFREVPHAQCAYLFAGARDPNPPGNDGAGSAGFSPENSDGVVVLVVPGCEGESPENRPGRVVLSAEEAADEAALHEETIEFGAST